MSRSAVLDQLVGRLTGTGVRAQPSGREPRRARLRQCDERLAIGFWIVLLSVGASFATTIVLAYMHVDATQLEAGTIGAFLGSSPIILMPLLVRVAYGEDSSFANRGRIEFRALTLLWGALFVCSRLRDWWPHHQGHKSSAIAIAGAVIAIFASWFWPHLPAATRIWMRKQFTLPGSRGDGGERGDQ